SVASAPLPLVPAHPRRGIAILKRAILQSPCPVRRQADDADDEDGAAGLGGDRLPARRAIWTAATAFGFLGFLTAWRRRSWAIETTELADRFRKEESVLVVPGNQLALSRGFRVGFGHDAKKTAEGLRRVEKVVRRLAA